MRQLLLQSSTSILQTLEFRVEKNDQKETEGKFHTGLAASVSCYF